MTLYFIPDLGSIPHGKERERRSFSTLPAYLSSTRGRPLTKSSERGPQMGDIADPAGSAEFDEQTGRDILFTTTATVGAVGAAAAVWPLIDQLNPAADTLALSSTEVDLEPIDVGQSITVVWRGKPVFIRHRSDAEIAAAQKDDKAELPDPQSDADRVKNAKWLVMVGVCTHFGELLYF